MASETLNGPTAHGWWSPAVLAVPAWYVPWWKRIAVPGAAQT